jgi:CubicO group peptidase (beta-lactamase class C family)/pimeloyl-ACP methyl ester carboxylesterase
MCETAQDLHDAAMDQTDHRTRPNPKKRRWRLWATALLSLALIAGACSNNATTPDAAPATDTTTPTGDEAATSPPSNASTELEAYFDQLDDSGFSGVVAVRDGSNLTTRAFGAADRENDVPVDAETVFDVGSLTKQFTAAAILRLEMDGRLQADDTLGEHVPGLPDDLAALTLHQLLTHTAGLPHGLGADDEPIGRDDYLALVAQTPLIGEPGERYAYSNVGYSLLAAVIELETGQPYEAYLHESLFEPAGMLDTGYVLPDWEGHTIAVGYDNASGDRFGRPNEQPWDVDGPYWHLLGNGGILSTAADMLRWDDALKGDLVLDATAKEKLFAPHVPEGEEAYYGYGWLIIPTRTDTPLIFHDGGNHIFYAGLLRLVDQNVTVFMATNSSQDADGDLVFEVANHVLDGGLDAMFDDTDDDSAIADPEACVEALPDVEMTCGRITVPVNHDEPGGDTFSLPYAVLPALVDDSAAEPVVFLQGGPGASTLAAVPLFVEYAELRADHDMIFFEQRGADPSGVFLSCDPDLATVADIQECHDGHVADGIDLSAFTTRNAAKDLALLREELGIERWHLLGASYGTTLAMVAMDNDPDGTASVILDAPTAPDVIIYNADIESLLNAFSKVFADCAADAGCDLRNPDLFTTHLTNYEGLTNEPWDISATGLAGWFGPLINQNSYLDVSVHLLAGGPGYLPAFITAMAERDANALLELASAFDTDQLDLPTSDPGFAQGLNYSIYCAEEAPFFDRTDTQIETVDQWPAGTIEVFLQPVEQICQIWDVEPADASDVDQIMSSIPTLILAGEYDHTTPLRQGQIAAAGLSEVELIEVPSTGHTTLDNACARRIMADFLRAPGGDRGCLADIAPMVWQ